MSTEMEETSGFVTPGLQIGLQAGLRECCCLATAEPAPFCPPAKSNVAWLQALAACTYTTGRAGVPPPSPPPPPHPHTHTHHTTIAMRAATSTLLDHVVCASQVTTLRKHFNHTKAVECGGQDLHWQIKETVLQRVLWHAACITVLRPERCMLCTLKNWDVCSSL